jgi:tetratricopeptide (TPR) repeat protein
MRLIRSFSLYSTLVLALAFAASACAKKEAAAPAAESRPAAAQPADGGKIPLTTASAEAKSEFLQGRDLSDKLRVTDSIPHFQKAVSLDPSFATAELNLATTAPTGKEFFDHLGKAVSLADKASNGEKLLILSTEAGANNNTAKQKELLDQLVAAYPNDERAHFALGAYYFAQQDFPQAIEHYKKATEIAPTYSNAFNLLGYAYRQNANFPEAEKAFQKYVELIPGDPNPPDSYAELLLKEGKFDEAITQYRKALSIDPNFINSHQGIAAALLYQGKTAQASAELDNITKKARTDAERRTALFAQTVVHVDGGKWAEALSDIEKQYALGQKTNDVPAMAGDLQLKGNILIEMGKPDQAKAAFDQALKTIEGSSLSDQVKENARRVNHFNLARVAIAKKDMATAKSEAEEYQKSAESANNPNQVKLAHELAGQIALAEKDWDKALSELAQANQQNPQNLYRQCQASEAKGDHAKAKEMCTQAANFNSLPALNYALVRTKAKIAAAKG